MSDPRRYEEFAALVRLHTNQLLAYINAVLLNWNDSDDLFQETCLVLWEKFDEFQPGTNFLAWAFRVADYKILKFRTRESRRASVTDKLRDRLKASFAACKAADAEASLTSLSHCMERLPQGDRDLATSCYGKNVPVRQVAETVGRSPESVHRSLRRIRAWLLECVQRELRRSESPDRVDHGLRRSESPDLFRDFPREDLP
jgi:RNA polymerase sigma-70 factor (ECF subfamily)